MNIDERNTLIISLYTQGATGKEITEAVGISAPTIYRVLRESGTTFRQPQRQDNPSSHRADAIRAAWAKKLTPEERSLQRIRKDSLPLIDVLRRLNLSLGKDNMGSYLYREDKKIYLSEVEFTMLVKKPMELLKAISSRINSAMNGGGNGEG